MRHGGLRRIEKRSFVLNVNQEELSDFLDYLERKMEGLDYSYRFAVPGKLYVTVYGTREEMARAEMVARSAYRNFALVHAEGPTRRYPRDWIDERRGGVSYSLLSAALQASGHHVGWSGDELITDVSPEEFQEMVTELQDLVTEARVEVRQRKVRETLVAAAYASGRPFLDVLEEALEEGLIEEDEDGVFWFRTSPEEVIRRLKGGGGEGA